MKKLMLTTAIASVLTTAAIAQTTITGELRLNYKLQAMDKGIAPGLVAAGGATTTADSVNGFGAEQQINIQTKGKLNVGGLEYAAGFAIENDGEQTGTLFNENVYMDFINQSSGTTVSFGRDHIQRSDTDFSATNLVGFTPNELSQTTSGTNKGTNFSQTVGAGPSQQYGAAIVQKVGTFGTLSYNYVPNNFKPASVTTTVVDATTVAAGASEAANNNSTTAYEYGFVGDLGVKGLQVHYFKNANNDLSDGTVASSVKAEGKNYGIKYNFGEITVAANRKLNQAETTIAKQATGEGAEITETAYAAAYAVNKDLTVGLLYAKAERSGTGITGGDQKVKAINVGYALGPVNLSAAYAQNENHQNIAGADSDSFMVRLIGAF
jgi:hypothetical protein